MAKAKDPASDGRKNNGGPRPKTRPDDKRGSPPGEAHQPAFEPSDTQRQRVSALARSCTDAEIAAMEEISVSTLQRHYGEDMRRSRANTTALIGSKLISAALDGCKARQMFYLRTKGGWSSKVEHTGAGGGPIRTFDLSGFTPEQVAQMMPLLDQLIEQGGGEFNPEDIAEHE